MKALRLFKKKPVRAPQRGADRLSPVPGVESHMQSLRIRARSDLPSDMLGEAPQDPTPEYIEEVGTPSEDVWAREEALYQEKNEKEPPA